MSFFGGPTSFDGLGVVFDTQPYSPISLRSDRKHWPPSESGHGADEWSVVSGVMDDGQGHTRWVEDKTRSQFSQEDEAAYLVSFISHLTSFFFDPYSKKLSEFEFEVAD